MAMGVRVLFEGMQETDKAALSIRQAPLERRALHDNHTSMTPDLCLTGRMLIAMPGIGDPRFERAVILICAHGDDHAMGIAVNHPVGDLTTPDLLVRLGVEANIQMPPDLVLFGGPVEIERGFVLHTSDYSSPPATLPVSEDLALTATREVLEAMGDRERAPRKSLLALGYAGWGSGQLEQELAQNAWLTCDPDETLLFGQDHDAKWALALAKLGIEPHRLSSEGGRA
jgi:putative transcriptional regulator